MSIAVAAAAAFVEVAASEFDADAAVAEIGLTGFEGGQLKAIVRLNCC